LLFCEHLFDANRENESRDERSNCCHPFCMPDQWTEMHDKLVERMARLRALEAEARALNQHLMTVDRASFITLSRNSPTLPSQTKTA